MTRRRRHVAGRRRRLSRRLDRGVRAPRRRRGAAADRAALCRCAGGAGTPAIVAVDMPIGLPERTGSGGRAAENAVRPLLGARQSSVFSVPSRAAIYARRLRRGLPHRARDVRPAAQGVEAAVQHRARKSARWTKCLRATPRCAARVFEVHPEVAFWRLNGERRVDGTEEGQEPSLRAGSRVAPETADRRGPVGRCRRTLRRPKGRPRRPARCAGLRRRRPAHSSGPGETVPGPATARWLMACRWRSGPSVCFGPSCM